MKTLSIAITSVSCDYQVIEDGSVIDAGEVDGLQLSYGNMEE